MLIITVANTAMIIVTIGTVFFSIRLAIVILILILTSHGNCVQTGIDKAGVQTQMQTSGTRNLEVHNVDPVDSALKSQGYFGLRVYRVHIFVDVTPTIILPKA